MKRIAIYFVMVIALLYGSTGHTQEPAYYGWEGINLKFGDAYGDSLYIDGVPIAATAVYNGYNAGMLTEPTIIDTTGVAVAVAAGTALLRATNDFTGNSLIQYTIPPSGALALTDDSLNYVYASYASGTPAYLATVEPDTLDYAYNVPVARVYMSGGDIEYQLSYNATGLSGAANTIHRDIEIHDIVREAGFALTETATNVVNIASGDAWFGNSKYSLDAIAQGGSGVYSELYFHTAGDWGDSTVTGYEIYRYDNGTNLVTLTANRYAVNWVFRNVNVDEIDIVLGTGDYTLAQALASTMPPAPDKLAAFYVLVGRIIVQKGDGTAYAIQSIIDTKFSAASVTAHGDLSGLTTGDDHPQYRKEVDTAYLDSTMVIPASLSGTNFASPLRFSGDLRVSGNSYANIGRANYFEGGNGASRVWKLQLYDNDRYQPTYPAISSRGDNDTGIEWLTTESNILLLMAKGVERARVDSLGIDVTGDIRIDSKSIAMSDEFALPIPDWPDTTASAQDSTTVKTFADLDGIKGQKKMLLVYGNASAAEDSTIWVGTFNPQFTTSDSLWFHAYSADASDTPFAVEIWDELGNIEFSSDQITLAGDGAWYRQSFEFTGFDNLEERSIVYRITTDLAADAIQIGQVYVKRN